MQSTYAVVDAFDARGRITVTVAVVWAVRARIEWTPHSSTRSAPLAQAGGHVEIAAVADQSPHHAASDGTRSIFSVLDRHDHSLT